MHATRAPFNTRVYRSTYIPYRWWQVNSLTTNMYLLNTTVFVHRRPRAVIYKKISREKRLGLFVTFIYYNSPFVNTDARATPLRSPRL